MMVEGDETYMSRAHAISCIFQNNSADFGGGVLCWMNSEPGIPAQAYRTYLVNCLIINNTATTSGGGVVSGGSGTSTGNGSSLVLSNTTVSQNTAVNNLGGGYWGPHHMSKGLIENSILWGDIPDEVVYNVNQQNVTINYSCLQMPGGWPGPGTGNIFVNPQFINPAAGDFRLVPLPPGQSPCINAGNNSLIPIDIADLDGDLNTTEPTPLDLAGNPRVIGGIVDMGAYEANIAIPE
jgi:hypothetical protein